MSVFCDVCDDVLEEVIDSEWLISTNFIDVNIMSIWEISAVSIHSLYNHMYWFTSLSGEGDQRGVDIYF